MKYFSKLMALCAVIFMATSLPEAPAAAQNSTLKKCPTSKKARYHNCHGTYRYKSGARYVGEYQNDKRHGQGTYFFKNGNEYVGRYERGQRNGFGTFTYKSGDKYVGNFKNGKRHGEGTYFFRSGNKYVGTYQNGKRTGFGTFTYKSGDEYIGNFVNNKRNGEGTYRFKNGNIYVGNYIDGQRNGFGKFNFVSGNTYVGNYLNGKRSGQGTFTFKSGSKYVGEFKNDDYDGQGTLFRADGSINKRGIFREDKLVQSNSIEQQVAIAPQAKQKPVVKAVPIQPQQKAPAFDPNQRRVALVIGNGAYQKAPALINPKNDASAMSSMLTSMGFTVFTGTDMNRQDMSLKIRDFIKEARQADVSLVFYAGHGIQVAGQNYLVPVDAAVGDPSAVDFELINVSSISSFMGGQNTIGIILLDACRDNPFTRSLARSLGTRSSQVGNGLAPIASQGGGLLVGFATAPGDVAADGRGNNSPFTTGLLKHLPTPGLEIELALKRVKATVVGMTKNQQRPWHNSDLSKEVYLTSR